MAIEKFGGALKSIVAAFGVAQSKGGLKALITAVGAVNPVAGMIIGGIVAICLSFLISRQLRKYNVAAAFAKSFLLVASACVSSIGALGVAHFLINPPKTPTETELAAVGLSGALLIFGAVPFLVIYRREVRLYREAEAARIKAEQERLRREAEEEAAQTRARAERVAKFEQKRAAAANVVAAVTSAPRSLFGRLAGAMRKS